MTDLAIFDYSGYQVRTVLVDGEPWFVVTDVCDFFGVTNRNRVMQDVDPDEKGGTQIDTPGGRQTVTIISEPGLYSLLFALRPTKARGVDEALIERRLEQLHKFKRWVTHDVLPTIRRTGQFGSQVPGTFAEALELAAAQQRAIEAAEAKIALDAPKVAAYDALMDADGFYDMLAASKILGIGRTTLFRRLRDEGILQRGSNLPYERHAHHFKVTTSSWTSPDGDRHTSYTTRVRPEGLAYLAKRLGVVLDRTSA